MVDPTSRIRRKKLLLQPGLRERSIYLLPMKERQEQLRKLDWVRDASIARLWPNKIAIQVTEREPVAFLTVPAEGSRLSRYSLTDMEGVILQAPAQARFTLPVALGKLQGAGEIRRIPINGRLDQQRYKYTVWRPNPLRGFNLSIEDANTELARRFFSWIGPASVPQFQWFSALGVKSAKAAVEPLKLEPIAAGSDLLMLPGDRAKLESFKPPKDPQYALVAPLDAILLLHCDERRPRAIVALPQ